MRSCERRIVEDISFIFGIPRSRIRSGETPWSLFTYARAMTLGRNEVPRQSVAHLFASTRFVAFASAVGIRRPRGSEDKDESAREKE